MFRIALRHKSAITLASVVTGTSAAAFHFSKSKTEGHSNELPRQTSNLLIIPTLQATLRAVRLLNTAALMAYDYKAPEWGIISKVESNQEREFWEKEEERRRENLKEAQEIYSRQSHPELTQHQRLEAKRKEKLAMNEAADKLAEAEEQLYELGSRKGQIHQKAANRLLDLCRTNGGVYIKVGQHLANLDYLIPQEYIETLSSLFDDTPRTSFEDVQEVLREDLGAEPGEIFEKFEEQPIASASLAQVHVAYERHTGRKLAVKVQHRGLRETSAGDIFAVVSVVKLAEKLFEGFTWAWLADEIAPQLPKELDFQSEGRNAERAAQYIKTTKLDCIIPEVIWKYSSSRVLTMQFEEGFKATDVERIDAAGLSRQAVARLVSSVFASQAFLSGWVHVDPHPANVLLRANKGRPQMVLVDHGLYRSLDDDFRTKYAALWKSLMLADLGGIENACRDLGIGEMYTLFAAMLTARPYDEIIERSKRGSLRQHVKIDSKSDQAVIRGYAQRFLTNIFELLNQVPRQMLLLLKMNDCLRHIDYTLGSPTNTLIVSGRYAAEAVFLHEVQTSKSWIRKFLAWYDYLHVLARIQLHDFLIRWVHNDKMLSE